MKVEVLPLGDAEVVHADAAFQPQAPLRTQLSRLGERLLELRLADGRSCRVGWVPEYSPGGAFRILVDEKEHAWGEDWPGVLRVLTELTQPSQPNR